MPLTLSRAPTVISLSQLSGEPGEAALPPLPPPAGVLTTPEKAVREVASGDSLLPLYSFPGSDGFRIKRIRSFGSFHDLGAAASASSHEKGASASAVPDVDDPASGGRAQYGSSDEDSLSLDGSSDSGGSTQVVPQRSVLDALLLGEWEDRAEAGLFRYDVTACPTKLVPGSYGFIAQCNEGRLSKKRPTEFRIDQVAQEFDDGKFNFKKALQKEVLFMFEPKSSSTSASGPNRIGGLLGAARDARRASHNSSGGKPSFQPAVAPGASPNLIFINVSPIEYGHVLLVPRALDNLQQLVTPDTLLLALQFAKEADNPYFRLAFNSLGAYGTINHLHFQAYYLAAPFAMERAPTAPLDLATLGIKPSSGSGLSSGSGSGSGSGPAAGSPPPAPRMFGSKGRRGRSPATTAAASGVRVEQLLEYPVRTLVFEAGDSLSELADLVGTACQRLTAANVPHNLFIADCGARVFLFPNCFAEKKALGQIPEDVLETQVDPAAWEIAGHIVLKRQQDYDCVTQASAWRLLELASCSPERFAEVARIALDGLV